MWFTEPENRAGRSNSAKVLPGGEAVAGMLLDWRLYCQSPMPFLDSPGLSPRPWRIAAAAVGCLFASALFAQSLQVIDLQYRTAAEVIPLLQPLLEPGGALTGQDYKLFVRASGGNVQQLRQALEQIDRQPRQFMVSLRRATRQQIEQEHAAVGGVIGDSGARVTLSTGNSRSRRDSDGISSVHVMEGNAAHIATGESVPVITSAWLGGDRHRRSGVTQGYRDVNSGFTVTPRLAGERVVLDIEQNAEHDDAGIRIQSLSTQISGKLGDWLPLGGVGESAQSQSSAIGSRRHATHGDDVQLWVRVTAAP